MSKEIETIKATFAKESNEKLIEFWTLNDRNEYSDDAFRSIEALLRDRGITPPPQLNAPPPPARPPGERWVLWGTCFVIASVLVPVLLLNAKWVNRLSGLFLVPFSWGLGCILVGLWKNRKRRQATSP